MNRVYWYAASFVLLLVLATVMAYLPRTSGENGKDAKPMNFTATKTIDRDWKVVLMGVPDYVPAVEEKPDTVESTPELTISDGKLLGIINTDSPSVFMLVPGESKPRTIGLNEGWLDNWVIETIYDDHVVWTHTQTFEKHTQMMFQ